MSEKQAPEVAYDPDLDPVAGNRQVAAMALELRNNPAFVLACANLNRHYLKLFCQLSPRFTDGRPNSDYEMSCVRANLAVNVIGDVLGQLELIAEHMKVDDAVARRTLAMRPQQ